MIINQQMINQVKVPVKPSTEGSVGDRRQVSQSTEIATTVPEAYCFNWTIYSSECY